MSFQRLSKKPVPPMDVRRMRRLRPSASRPARMYSRAKGNGVVSVHVPNPPVGDVGLVGVAEARAVGVGLACLNDDVEFLLGEILKHDKTSICRVEFCIRPIVPQNVVVGKWDGQKR